MDNHMKEVAERLSEWLGSKDSMPFMGMIFEALEIDRVEITTEALKRWASHDFETFLVGYGDDGVVLLKPSPDVRDAMIQKAMNVNGVRH